MNDEFEYMNIFVILTKIECNCWFGTIAYDFRFHQTIRICCTDSRRANIKLKISASKKRYARYSFALSIMKCRIDYSACLYILFKAL